VLAGADGDEDEALSDELLVEPLSEVLAALSLLAGTAAEDDLPRLSFL
jgi:hypothetical protein